MKVTENMAATLPDSEDINEALRLNLRAKKSSAQKISKSKSNVKYIALFFVDITSEQKRLLMHS